MVGQPAPHGAHRRHADTHGRATGQATGARARRPYVCPGAHEPALAASETCRLAGYGDQAVVDEDLLEWDYGEYEGRTRVDIRRDNPGWTIWTGDPPGGETAEQVALRTKRVIDRLLTANGDVALFAHGHVLRILATTWLGLAPADGGLLALDTATLSVLGFENETRVVRQWNAPTDEDA